MKTFRLLSFLFVFVLLLDSCTSDKQNISDLPASCADSIEKTTLPISENDPKPSINFSKKRKTPPLTKAKLYERLQNQVQKFEISSAKDTSLTGEQGTKLAIRKNSFLLNGQPYEGPISLQLKECYSYEDMILNNLSTHSNDRLLESGGMICLEAFTNDHQKLTLDRNQSIGLQMPSEAPKEYMQLFYADKNMNWLQASDSKPQFAAVNNRKKSRNSDIRAGNYFITNNGYGTVVTTVNILKDGVERQLSSTSYACFSLFQSLQDTMSLYFEIDANGYISNSKICDSIFGKNLKITTYKLTSMNDVSLNYSVYTPRGSDCNLLLRGEYINLNGSATLSFIVPRPVHSELKKNAQRSKTKVIVRNTYIFRSRGYVNQERIKDVQAKLDSSKGSIKDISTADLQYYAFSINQLGWINCDRFYNVPANQKTNFMVANEAGTDLKLVFSDMKSVLNGYQSDGKMMFNNVPKGRAVTLIGIRIVNEKAELAMLKTTTQEICQEQLVYTPVSVEELKEKIKKEL